MNRRTDEQRNSISISSEARNLVFILSSKKSCHSEQSEEP
jgi:hypothetical protein